MNTYNRNGRLLCAYGRISYNHDHALCVDRKGTYRPRIFARRRAAHLPRRKAGMFRKIHKI